MTLKQAEVDWGEGQEARVLGRWLRAQQGKSRAGGMRAIKSRRFQDWDYLILDGSGLPYAYVEIKVRRRNLSEFGDAISPVRKHDLARKLHLRHGIDFLMVTEYPDALVVVNLADTPTRIGPLWRTGRPGPVDHAFWTGAQLKVVA